MEPEKITYDICRCYLQDLKGVDAGLIAKLLGFLRARNLPALASCSCHFDRHIHAINEWRALRQVEAFFKKNSTFSNKDICFSAAEASFRKNEAICAETNARLDFYYTQRDLLDPDLRFWMSRIERYICNVLGPITPFINELPSLIKVTSGATANASRRDSLPQLKMRLKLYSTSGARAYLKALYRYNGFESLRCVEVKTNRIELVPKNWKTDRTIACEPEGNLPLQLAFDRYAKRRLRRVGIDLRDQSANREMARRASINDDFVTVDFSAASDTVSFATVAWCFPYEWFSYLVRVRSPEFRGVFGEGSYFKFSSMGNGSTFTIETLLFAAACYAVGSSEFLVYGDDVIIHKDYYEKYLRLTRFLGFLVNEEKTFRDGPFRESCGLDCWQGVDVTPVYIRTVDRRKAILCHLINSLVSIALPGGKLASYLLSLMKQYNLPVSPYSQSTISGVHIVPDLARRLGVLRTRSYVNYSKSYVPRTRPRKFTDIRGYYLWWLSKKCQVSYSIPWSLAEIEKGQQTSSVPIFDHVYVRKWVGWKEHPLEAMPLHLYWWSELIESVNMQKT